MRINHTFAEKLKSCRCLGELEGFANRRKFNPALPRWTEDERRQIMARKYEMERSNGKKKSR